MRQVAAMAEIHGQDGVTRFQPGSIDGFVGWRAGVRLDVGVIGFEELLSAIDGKLFDFSRCFPGRRNSACRDSLRNICW